jgi:hypothetical protein
MLQTEGGRAAGYVFKHGIKVAINVFVADADDAPAIRLQIGRTSAIMAASFISPVRGSIDFDHQPRRDAGKVRDVRPKRMLAPEA